MTTPSLLADEHDVSTFSCRDARTNAWLSDRAWRNQRHDWSRVWVVCDGMTVVGFYMLNASVLRVSESSLPRRLRAKAPADIPAILLGQLGVDQRYEGRGLGRYLLRDALDRCRRSSREIAAAVVVLDMLEDDLFGFYEPLGFQRTMPGSRRLFLEISSITG